MIDANGYICMAVYKPDFTLLERQIVSIREQSVTNWNCVIGIDGADLDAVEVLTRLTMNDDRFVVHEFSDRVGFYRNFERILCLVDPDAVWVALADQDDVWYSNKLRCLLEHLEPVSMVLGQARLVRVDEDIPEPSFLGVTNRSYFSIGELVLDNVVSGALAVFRADILQAVLPFPPKTDVSYHDHWIGLCAAVNRGIISVPFVVQDYVQHGSNVIGEELGSSIRTRARSLSLRSVGFSGALRYLVNHRWRWRVSMARTALLRFPHLGTHERRVLVAFAADRSTLRLLKLVLGTIARGKCSTIRVISLYVASIFAPIISEEVQIEA